MLLNRRNVVRFACCCLLAASSTVVFAQPPADAKVAVGTAVDPAQVYGKLLTLMEGQFVSAAEAMPEDKYSFAPTQGEYKGVRTFGEEVRHVAQANAYFFHDPNKPLVDTRADYEKLKTKAEIVKALKDSFVMAHAYVDGITAANAFVQTPTGTRAGQAAMGIAHFMDHYGQLVEYLRMNSIVPPATANRGKPM